MGGRGASSGGVAGGGMNPANITGTTSLISAREGKSSEVDMTLAVLRDVQDQYRVDVSDVQLATIKGKDANVLAYYDAGGNLAVNQSYFDNNKMDEAMDKSYKSGYHPSRGNKSGLEAVVAHEAGHRLTDVVGERTGKGQWAVDQTSSEIVQNAARKSGHKGGLESFRSQVSGYARESNAEAVAEAFTDVYCNGSKASSASKAIVNELNGYF